MENLKKAGVTGDCGLLAMWKSCENGACCSDGTPHLGYSKHDAPVGYCVNDVLMVAKSLTDEKNCDDPIKGMIAVPATWAMCSLEDWIDAKIAYAIENNPYKVVDIDDSNPDTTTLTLNNGMQLSSPEQPDNDKRLTNPRMNADGTAVIWDVIDATGAVVDTETQPVPASYFVNNCAGAKVPAGTNMVACSEFNGLFEAKIKEGCYAIGSADTTCNPLSKVAHDGCKFVTVTDADLCIANGAYSGDLQIFPADQDDPSQWLVRTEITDSGSLNSDSPGFLYCVDIPTECAGTYTVTLNGGDIIYQDELGESVYLPVLNGLFLDGSTTNPISTQSFTNHASGIEDTTFDVNLPAGNNELCVYLVATGPDKPPAQMNILNDRVKICKAVA